MLLQGTFKPWSDNARVRINGLLNLPVRSVAARIPEQAGRSDAAQALDQLLNPQYATRELRAELLGVLESFTPEQVEKLCTAGYRISYKCLPSQIGGIQNGYQKRIDLNPSWAPNERRRAALHEITHALDFLKRQSKLGPVQRFFSRFDKPYASQLDSRLEHLYRGYLTRTASPQTQPRDWEGWARGARTPALVTALAVGASLATGLVPVAAAAAVVGTAWTGKKLAETVFAPRETDRFAEPREYRPDAEQHVVSEYAARSHKVYEYLAEGVAFYLNNQAERELLRQRDPGLFEYVEEWNRVG
ncbi:MAG: hypothetical protein AMXMBFR33_36960 [Candidatus Xenobia bacterium]